MFFIHDLISLFVMVLIHLIITLFLEQAYGCNILPVYLKVYDSYLEVKDPFGNNSNPMAPESAE